MKLFSLFKKRKNDEREPEYYSNAILASVTKIHMALGEAFDVDKDPFWDSRIYGDSKFLLELFWGFYCHTIWHASLFFTDEKLQQFDQELFIAIRANIKVLKSQSITLGYFDILENNNTWRTDYPDHVRFYLRDELNSKEMDQFHHIKSIFMPKGAEIEDMLTSICLKLYLKTIEALELKWKEHFIYTLAVYEIILNNYKELSNSYWSSTLPSLFVLE